MLMLNTVAKCCCSSLMDEPVNICFACGSKIVRFIFRIRIIGFQRLNFHVVIVF